MRWRNCRIEKILRGGRRIRCWAQLLLSAGAMRQFRSGAVQFPTDDDSGALTTKKQITKCVLGGLGLNAIKSEDGLWLKA